MTAPFISIPDMLEAMRIMDDRPPPPVGIVFPGHMEDAIKRVVASVAGLSRGQFPVPLSAVQYYFDDADTSMDYKVYYGAPGRVALSDRLAKGEIR